LLVQVCESMAEPQTRKREVAALSDAMAELGLKSGTIVTRNEEEEIEVDGGKIEAVPVWRFQKRLGSGLALLHFRHLATSPGSMTLRYHENIPVL
jgi:hypothetical protein